MTEAIRERPEPDEGNLLAGVQWDCTWDSEAAARMFAAIRTMCGVRVGPAEADVVQALQDAREILEREDQMEEPIAAEIDNDGDDYDMTSLRAACRRADAAQRLKPADQRIERLRRLMEPDVTLERAWLETNHPWRAEGRAAESTVFALMQGLRERGTAALEEAAVRQRLAQLSDQQLLEVGDRLQRLKPEIARAWNADEVEALMRTRETLR
jgi:hypothetical protein